MIDELQGMSESQVRTTLEQMLVDGDISHFSIGERDGCGPRIAAVIWTYQRGWDVVWEERNGRLL